MSGPIKPTATDYSRQKAARDRRLAEWMGLDLTILSIEDSEPDPATPGFVVVTWRTLDSPVPSPRGHAHPVEGASDGKITEFTNAVTLDGNDAAEMLAAVGPKPQLLSPAQRATLEQLR